MPAFPSNETLACVFSPFSQDSSRSLFSRCAANTRNAFVLVFLDIIVFG